MFVVAEKEKRNMPNIYKHKKSKIKLIFSRQLRYCKVNLKKSSLTNGAKPTIT